MMSSSKELPNTGLTSIDIDNLTFKLCRMTDDDLFQSNLINIVKPILFEISKNNDSRPKLFELLVHINNRIRALRQLKMSLEPFIDLFNDSNLSIPSRNFAHMYVKLCYPKYDADSRIKLLPLIFGSLTEDRTMAQKDILLHTILLTLQHVKVNEFNRKAFELTNLVYQRRYIIEFLTLILLTPYNFKSLLKTDGESNRVPDGMNTFDFNRVIKNDVTPFLANDDLEKIKCGIVNFLTQRVFPDDEIIVAICIAHSDTRHSVVSLVDKEAKCMYMQIDWEKSDVLNLVLDWFIPRMRNTDPQSRTNFSAYFRQRLPVAVQIKMAGLLMRSKITLPNKLASAMAEAASVTFLEKGKVIHPKQVESGFSMVSQLCSFSSELTEDISDQLLKNLILFIQRPMEQHEVSLKVKSLNLLPQVLKRNHKFLLNDTDYLSQLFASLGNKELDQELKDAFKDCLKHIAIILQTMKVSDDQSISSNLETVLYDNFNKGENECRIAVVYFAGLVYPSTHIPTRYLLLEALCDRNKFVKEEAENVLSDLHRSTTQHDIVMKNIKLPPFVELVNNYPNLFNKNVFADHLKLIPVVEYMRMCILAMEDGLTDVIKREIVYDKQDDYRFRIYNNILTLFNSDHESNGNSRSRIAVDAYSQYLQVVFYTKSYFVDFLEEVVAASPTEMLRNGHVILQRIKVLLTSDSPHETFNRESCASVFAILTVQTEDDTTLEKTLKSILDSLPTLVNKQIMIHKTISHAYIFQGHSLGFSFLIERLLGQKRNIVVNNFVVLFLEKIEVILSATMALSSESTTIAFQSTNALIESLCVIFECLHSLGQCGALKTLVDGGLADDVWPTKTSIAKRCFAYIRGTYPMKVKEGALRALSGLALGETEETFSPILIDLLMQTYSMKDPILHLSIAKTLVDAIMRTNSPFKGRWYERKFCVGPIKRLTESTNEGISTNLQLVLNKVHEILAQSNSISRHNVTVWCLSIVQNLGWHSSFNLGLLHSRMLIMLGDKNETTQDVAARVLASIYEHSKPDERRLMSEELVQVILHGQRGRLNVEDSFTDAELESRESNKATYKELCSLAMELNQPDLIYSFMPLAIGQSQWSARGGASVGLCHLMALYGNELEPQISRMVPKLFRYRFDQHPRTQRAMELIWNNLGSITATDELIRRCFPAIVTEIRVGLTSSEPRIRDASCRALTAVLKHDSADPLVICELGELVTNLFRVMDDARENVRATAIDASQAVQKFCSMILDDPGRRQSIESLLAVLISVLLDQGLTSTVSDVNDFSIGLLSAFVRSGRAAVRGAVPRIAVTCLQALSSLESTEHNYISQQLAGTGNYDSKERWDMQRLSIARRSPLSEILTMSIRYVDEDTFGQLLLPLVDIIKNGIGLATKCETAEFLVDLSLHCGSKMMGATGKLLAALLYAVIDKNEVVQREMSKAIGYLVKYSKKSSIEKLFAITRRWFFEKQDSEENQWACCYVYNAVEKYAPGILELHSSATLPLIFLAKQNEPSEANDNSGLGSSQKKLSTQQFENALKRKVLWSQTWVECVRLEAVTVMELMPHILSCVSEALSSVFHGLRTQASLALMALVRGLGKQWGAGAGVVNANNDVWGQLYDAIVGALSASVKWWPGKVYLLYGTMSFIRQVDEHKMLSVVKDRDMLVKFLMKEVVQNNRSSVDTGYRCVAFEAVAKVSDILGEECIVTLLPMVAPMIAKGEMQVPAPEREMLVRVIGHMWPGGYPDVQRTYFLQVIQLLTTAMEDGQWKQQIAALKSFKSVFKKTTSGTVSLLLDPDSESCPNVTKSLKSMIKPWKRAAEMSKYKQLRESCLDTIEVLLNNREYDGLLRDSLRSLLQTYCNDGVASIKEKSVNLLKMI